VVGVTGIGGVFFRAEDPAALQSWYVEHLGMEADADGYVVFRWGAGGPSGAGSTVWAPFPADTDYLGPGQWMVNYRVDDLDELLERLCAAGVRVDDELYEDANGRFGWCFDPEGNRIELWQPAPGM
jgi:predicted enzyme related to lactoylglutathione lyase